MGTSIVKELRAEVGMEAGVEVEVGCGELPPAEKGGTVV